MSKSSKNIVKIKATVILILQAIGISLLAVGVYERNRVIYEVYSSPRGILILSEEDITIDYLSIMVWRGPDVFYEENWLRAHLMFQGNFSTLNLGLVLPGETKNMWADNVLMTNSLRYSCSYNKTTDFSTLLLHSDSSENFTFLQLGFSWKIYERISFDKFRISITFEYPVFNEPIEIQQKMPTRTYIFPWIPKINRVYIHVEGALPLALSYTIPQPSSYSLLNSSTAIYWGFELGEMVSSIQAVFQDPFLSEQKSDTVFFAGLLIAFGTSTILWALKEIVSLFDLLNKRERGTSKS